MKDLAELAAEGLRGKALTDALHQEMFGVPPPDPNRTPEQMQRSLERFFALMDSLTEEELSVDILQGRPLNVSILDGRPMSEVELELDRKNAS